MAGEAIELSWEGYEEIMQALTRASQTQLLTLADFAGEELVNVSRQAFKDRADPETGKKWKDKVDGSPATLVKSGSMFRNMIYEAFSDGSAIIGNPKIYSRAHNKGYPEGNLPARPFININDGIIRNIMEQPEVKEILAI